jgi:uncharacterized repeat protein (TIGR03803 family)
MRRPKQGNTWNFGTKLRMAALTIALALALMSAAQAQTYQVLYTFTGQLGVNPVSGLTMDKAGNLYGTTNGGGITGGTCGDYGCGTVFKLAHSGSGWILRTLYRFAGGDDGAEPQARVVFGPDGSLYGTTAGAGESVPGTVFQLKPPALTCKSFSCPWAETVLHLFTDGGFGATPNYGDVVFDQAGNLYGATIKGGVNNFGAVYELTPSGGDWTESVIYSFTAHGDGAFPYGGVVLDNAGNLHGTTYVFGGDGYGTVYRLMPSGSGWAENTLYSFQDGSDGGFPATGLIFDPSGNLYGTTSTAGPNGGGTVFELAPSNGNWSFNLLYGFAGSSSYGGPWASLTMDAAGNLYGTAVYDGAYDRGSIFKQTPSVGGWTYTDLHDFTGGSDGEYPYSNVIFDASGNLYGTAQGGAGGGVIWEITP